MQAICSEHQEEHKAHQRLRLIIQDEATRLAAVFHAEGQDHR